MAALSEVAHDSSLSRDSTELGREVQSMQAEMERSIQLAGLRNDPTAPIIRTLTASLGLQWRLHNQAVRYFRDASDRLDQQLADTIRQGDAALQARRLGIVEGLMPELTRLIAAAVRTWNRSITVTTALTFGGFAVALAFGVGLAGYGAGWQAGHSAAQTATGALVDAIHQAAPGAETAMVDMVRANNVAEAWAKCQNTAATDKDGRRVCEMAMWVDPQGQPKS